MTTKSGATNIKAVPQDEPEDVALARQLSAAVTKFNAGTVDRTALSIADRKALDKISAMAGDLTPFRFDPRYSGATTDSRSIEKKIAEFAEVVTGVAMVTVGKQQIGTPAIESAAVRAHVARLGREIASALDSYAEERLAAIKLKAEQVRAEAAAVERAKNLPLIGPLIPVYAELYRMIRARTDEHGIAFAAENLEHSIRNLMDRKATADAVGIDPFALIEAIRRSHDESGLGRDVA